MLSNQEMEEIHELGQHLSRTTNREQFLDESADAGRRELALRSLTSAFARTQWQDRVMDASIVLEALLPRSDTEIAHRVSTRTALLMGTDGPHSQRLFKTVHSFYSLRSAIVHGGEKPSKEAAKTIKAWAGESAVPAEARTRGLRAAELGLVLAS